MKVTALKSIIIFLMVVMYTPRANGVDNEVLRAIDNGKEFISLDNACPTDLYKGPEKEYRNYILFCSVAQETCLSECRSGKPNYCFGLANNLQDGSVDKRYAERLYSMACQQGLVIACTNRAAGIMRYDDDNKSCYANSFKFTCGKNDAWGCTMYGLVLLKGIGVEQDHKLALEVLKTACKQGVESESCQFAKEIEENIINSKKD